MVGRRPAPRSPRLDHDDPTGSISHRQVQWHKVRLLPRRRHQHRRALAFQHPSQFRHRLSRAAHNRSCRYFADVDISLPAAIVSSHHGDQHARKLAGLVKTRSRLLATRHPVARRVHREENAARNSTRAGDTGFCPPDNASDRARPFRRGRSARALCTSLSAHFPNMEGMAKTRLPTDMCGNSSGSWNRIPA